jgi:hypothetical protein
MDFSIRGIFVYSREEDCIHYLLRVLIQLGKYSKSYNRSILEKCLTFLTVRYRSLPFITVHHSPSPLSSFRLVPKIIFLGKV